MQGLAALASYEEQARLIEVAVRAAAIVWADLDPSRFTASWVRAQIGERLVLTTARAQELAAMAAAQAADLILTEQGTPAEPVARVSTTAVAGVASDGRTLDGLLLQPLIYANRARVNGATLAESMAAGEAALARIVATQVADASRAASGLSIVARPRVGWVRLVEPKACARCAILAGRWYRWSSGFERHPMCKCRNIPTAEDTPGLTSESDPMTLFRSLSEADQNRQFTVAGAQAIRDGADISRVVNARRGALGLDVPGRLTAAERAAGQRKGDRYRQLQRVDVYGRRVSFTTDNTTARSDVGRRLVKNGAPVPRLMPEAIYEIADDREDALRLLRRFGYLL